MSCNFLAYLCHLINTQTSAESIYWPQLLRKSLYTYVNMVTKLMVTIKPLKIAEKKFSLCKGQTCIDKEPIWITKPYMKAFLEENKDTPNYCLISLCSSCTHKCAKVKKVRSWLPVASNIKNMLLQDKLNLQEHFANFFVRLYHHSH